MREAVVCQETATLTLARKAQRHDWHILHNTTTTVPPPNRLKSWHPYSKAAQDLLSYTPDDRSLEAGVGVCWPTVIHRYIQDPGGSVKGENLPRRQWTLLNRLGTEFRVLQSIHAEVGPGEMSSM